MEFYDSARWPLIPEGVTAALGHDGEFAAPADAPAKLHLKDHRWITVRADYRNCSIQDVMEQPWVTPAMVRGFVRGRKGLGMDAIMYVDRAQAAEAVAYLWDFGNGELLAYPRLYWWVATFPERFDTPEALAAELAGQWEAPEITADRIWANQHTDAGSYDVSTLYLPWSP
jgi:hypothetical protein